MGEKLHSGKGVALCKTLDMWESKTPLSLTGVTVQCLPSISRFFASSTMTYHIQGSLVAQHSTHTNLSLVGLWQMKSQALIFLHFFNPPKSCNLMQGLELQ